MTLEIVSHKDFQHSLIIVYDSNKIIEILFVKIVYLKKIQEIQTKYGIDGYNTRMVNI